jgi:hypothetical protein
MGMGAVEDLVEAMCERTGDDEPEKRVALAADTEAKLRSPDARVSGWPSLVKLLGAAGEEVVGRVRALLGVGREIAATYDYQDEAGCLLFQVVRFANPKGFAQRRPDGKGGWIWDLRGVSRVLYRLPELVSLDSSETVFVVEGEKDTDNLRDLGLVTTTCPGGAGKWRPAYANVLRGRPVVILPDNDDPGREHACKVARSLAGTAASVKLLALPGLPDGGDVSDWLAAGGTNEKLLRLAEEAPLWRDSTTNGTAGAPSNEQAYNPPPGKTDTGTGEVALEVRCLDGVRPEPVEHLVEDFLPRGKVTLFAGRGGLGKSVATLDLAAAVTAGRCAFGLIYTPPPPADVLLASAEDDTADTVVPRLLAAGADLSRVHEVQGLRDKDGRLLPFSLADCDVLARELERRPGVKLVVIDPVGVFAGRTGADTHKEAPVQALLAGLRDLAVAGKVAVVLVAHVNKSEEAKARNRVSGSAAFVNSARAAYLFTEDEEAPGRRLVLPIKFNAGREPQGIIYGTRPLTPEEVQRVRPALAHLDDARQAKLLAQLFRLEWKGRTAETADEVLARRAAGAPKDAERAADWLKAFLAGGPQPSEVCVSQGNRALGLTRRGDWWSGRVLRDLLGGKPRKLGQREGAQWWYTLPHHAWPPEGTVHYGTPDGVIIDQPPPGNDVILRGPWVSAQVPQEPQEPQEPRPAEGEGECGSSETPGPDPQEPGPASAPRDLGLEVLEGVEALEKADDSADDLEGF